MKRWGKIMLHIGKAISTGGFSEVISNYEELEEKRIEENWRIMQRKNKSLRTTIQKIGVMISGGGFLIELEGKP